MKKFLALVCMITCIFGLTACGSEEVLTDYEQQKVQYAQQLATQTVVPFLAGFMDDANKEAFEQYTDEEMEYIVSNDYSLNADGYAVAGAVESFHSAAASMGSITAVSGASAEIKDDQIVVTVDVEGELKNAQAVIIFSNDMFMVLESAALNPVSSMGELMGRAVLNTIIGMGTVFAVLILISLIISCFAVIPKIQNRFAKKEEKPEAKTTGIDNAVAQIVSQEESEELSDDLELVAVIAAAIAASQGAASTDGFVVRSIRKARR